MIATVRPTRHLLFVLAMAAVGCETGDATPGNSPAPSASAPAPSEASPAKPEPTVAAAPESEKAAAKADPAGIKLEKVKFDEFAKRMANKDAKYTLVDVWATWCLPCKKEFHHAVEMHHKYSGKGLAVASLSFDDPAEAKQVHDAQEFLAEKKAVMTNYLLDEEQGVGNEKLNINAIPAVFIYGPDGKEVKRFTMDDPNKQFTYDDVEKTVVALLEGKPLPTDESPKPKTSEK